MFWHAIVLADLEFIELRLALGREYQREIAAGGSRAYALYGLKRHTGVHVVYVPPEAFHLFEQLPNWRGRLRQYADTPDLAGCKATPIR